MRQALVIFSLAGVVLAAEAQNVYLPAAAETGTSYRELDATTRGWYLRGLVDGLLGAAQFGGDEKLAAVFFKCLAGMNSIDIEGVVDRYLADHPDLWHKGMHALAANAIIDTCPEYSKQLIKSDFWRRTAEPLPAPK